MRTITSIPKPRRRPPGRPRGGVGTPNRDIIYVCSTCNETKHRDELLAKRVSYSTIQPNRVIRSRTVAWVCRTCAEREPEWNQPRFFGAPGNADVVRDGKPTD